MHLVSVRPTLVTPTTAPVARPIGPVITVETTPNDLQAMGDAFRAAGERTGWLGPVTGRYDLQIRFPDGNGGHNVARETGVARVHHARIGSDEWALVPFFNPDGTGFMHQPAVLHRPANGSWTVVADDPPPGEYDQVGIPNALLQHWGIVDGMPPADSVASDQYPF